jgi:hypothetical protein
VAALSLVDQIKSAGWQAVLEAFADVYPDIDLTVKLPEAA